MVRRPILPFIGWSSNIGQGRRPTPILTAEANKRQYWLTDHPLFVIFYIKITPIMGAGPKSPIKRCDGCIFTFPIFRMVNLLRKKVLRKRVPLFFSSGFRGCVAGLLLARQKKVVINTDILKALIKGTALSRISPASAKEWAACLCCQCLGGNY